RTGRPGARRLRRWFPRSSRTGSPPESRACPDRARQAPAGARTPAGRRARTRARALPLLLDLQQELAAQVGVLVEEAAPERRRRPRAVLGHAARVDELDERVRDLLAHPFLDGEAACVEADDPRQLRDADDLAARDVCHVRRPVERKRVMLAQRVERDWPFEDEPGVRGRVLGRERGEQLRVAVVACGRVVERAQKARRRLTRARRVEIHAEGSEDLAGVPLETLPVGVADAACCLFVSSVPRQDDCGLVLHVELLLDWLATSAMTTTVHRQRTTR